MDKIQLSQALSVLRRKGWNWLADHDKTLLLICLFDRMADLEQKLANAEHQIWLLSPPEDSP